MRALFWELEIQLVKFWSERSVLIAKPRRRSQ